MEIVGEDPRVYCILSKEFIDDGNGATDTGLQGSATISLDTAQCVQATWPA